MLVRYADDLLAICRPNGTPRTPSGAQGNLAGLGSELKPSKTRIVHLREGGEGLEFLGFHHR